VDDSVNQGTDGPEGSWLRPGVHPDDITAPQPVVTGPHHHEGPAGPAAATRAGRRRGVLVVAGVTAGVLVVGMVGAVALSRVSGTAVASGTPSATVSGSTPTGVGLTPHAAPPADATDTATPPPLPPAQPTLVLGDSLGLTVYPWLADLLPDRYVSYEAEVGRTTPATEKKLLATSPVPPVVIVSSGTNDPVANVFEESARRILDQLGSQRCVVWVDVVRPDSFGDSQTMMNAALDRAVSGRPNVRVLRWSELVAAHPEWMSGDGIHPNEAGSTARAQAFAEAAQGCSALDPTAPRARRQYLPQSIFWGPVSGQYRAPSGSSTRSTHRATPTRTSSPASHSASTSAKPSTSATPSRTTTPTPTSTPPSTTPTTTAPTPPETTADPQPA
jgi:hypothetical protein